MLKVIAGIFLLLHAFVHLLYFGQSARRFELQPGLTWPDGSWAFSKLFGDSATRALASAGLILAALGFVVGAAGIFFGQPWWRTAVVASATFSILIYILFWNGRWQHLDGQGAVGILIELAILAVVLVFRWPKFNF